MNRVKQKKKLSEKLLIEMYRKMVRIRAFETKVAQLFLKGVVPGTIHLSTGQEAVAAGATSCLRPTVLAEILGRADGCCHGKGGSMHLADPQAGIMPSLPIVGAGIPIAAGIAFAFKYDASDSVAMGFFGDGATNIGAFHEAMNLAALWKLPVIYVCENNLYAVSTRIQSATLVTELSEKAKLYGMTAATIDGNDVEAVYLSVAAAVDRARRGEGPAFIECKTYRHSGHSRTDPATYRDETEVKAWKERDPLILCRRVILKRGYLDDKECGDLEAEEEQLIEQAAQFALSSPEPEGVKALEDVYADG
jgi:TPP-dependent pyruvate/acetoin dehydrogenase alpha subunit